MSLVSGELQVCRIHERAFIYASTAGVQIIAGGGEERWECEFAKAKERGKHPVTGLKLLQHMTVG